MPKQFVTIVGSTSTFQQVLARVNDAELFGRPIVITNADFRFVVAEQLRQHGIEADIVLEPVRRDSGLAVAVSAVLAAERNRDALVLVLAADHVARKPDEFRQACRRVAMAAAEGRMPYDEVLRRLDQKAREKSCERWLHSALTQIETTQAPGRQT